MLSSIGFSILIWLGALMCVVAYLIEASAKPNPSKDNLFLGCVLIAVDVICGLFSFFQNYKSSKVRTVLKLYFIRLVLRNAIFEYLRLPLPPM